MFPHPQISHNLHITAWNANSMTNKKAELDMFLRINKIDIAAVSETKLSPNRRFSNPGYTTVRTDRNKFGGGTLLPNNKLRHDKYCLPSLTGLEATAIYIYKTIGGSCSSQHIFRPHLPTLIPTSTSSLLSMTTSFSQVT